MFSRLLLIAGLVAALVGLLDPVIAGPRRRALARTKVPAIKAATKATSSPALKQIIYPVADLVVPIPSRDNLDVDPLPGPRSMEKSKALTAQLSPLKSGPSGFAAAMLKNGGRSLEVDLMELVRTAVAPASWTEQGGHGSVQYYPLGMSLVVNQTAEVQEEVQALLAALRRLQDLMSAVELRVITTTPAVFEKACKELRLTRVAEKDQPETEGARTVAPKGKRWTSFLDQDQTRQLLENLQHDRSTTVMQAPKMTMFNGQNAAVQSVESQFFLTSVEAAQTQGSDEVFFVPTQRPWLTGLSLGLQPILSADRQFVRVRMKGYWSQLAGPVELQPVQMPIKTKNEKGKVETQLFQMFLQKPKFAQVRLDEELNIPDGGTALISCGVVPMEIERTDLVACINKFLGGEKMTTSADRHVFFLITPRVIVNEEEEVRLQGAAAPVVVRP